MKTKEELREGIANDVIGVSYQERLRTADRILALVDEWQDGQWRPADSPPPRDGEYAYSERVLLCDSSRPIWPIYHGQYNHDSEEWEDMQGSGVEPTKWRTDLQPPKEG